MIKRLLLTGMCLTLIVAATACKPQEKPPEAPPAETPVVAGEQAVNDAKNLVSQNEEPEKMVALIESGISDVDTNGAEIMISGLEELQESHLAEYTDLLLTDENQQALAAVQGDINQPDVAGKITDPALSGLLQKLQHSGYRFENLEGSWYPIINYSSYKAYSQFLSEEMQDYVELMALESDAVSMKDGAIVIGLDDLTRRLITSENYILKHAASPRIDRVKEVYAGYLWNYIGGANNTPIYDWDTLKIRQEVRDSYEKFSRENPNLTTTKAVRDWLNVLRDENFVFNENTMYQALDNIYGEALKALGIEADYK